MNYTCEKCLKFIVNGALNDGILLCQICAWDKKIEDDLIYMRLNNKLCQKCGGFFSSIYANAQHCNNCKTNARL
jgi:hypothetical protein